MREYLESGIKLLDLNLPIETIDKLIKYICRRDVITVSVGWNEMG